MTPVADMLIEDSVVFTYTYDAPDPEPEPDPEPTPGTGGYLVTFKVVNGAWNDETREDKMVNVDDSTDDNAGDQNTSDGNTGDSNTTDDATGGDIDNPETTDGDVVDPDLIDDDIDDPDTADGDKKPDPKRDSMRNNDKVMAKYTDNPENQLPIVRIVFGCAAVILGICIFKNRKR